MEIQPLTGNIGAKLSGLDLAAGLGSGAASELTGAIHKFGVVVLPDQPLTDDQQLALAESLGRPAVYPLYEVLGGGPTIQPLINDKSFPPAADHWHTDVTWSPTPPRYGMLNAVDIPATGGDTLWVDTAAAHDALSPVMQDMLEPLQAHHSAGEDLYAKVALSQGQDVADRVQAAFGDGVDHPLICVVPETQRRAIFIARHFTTGIVGLSDQESSLLLDFLFAHCEQAQFQFRWKWSVGDIVIWDERRTMHLAMGDYFPQRREMRRCTIDDGLIPAGSSPTGI